MKRSYEQTIFSFSYNQSDLAINHYSPKGKVFECKTCNKQFPSFQALGGHRASHKKPRIEGDFNSQPKMHACPICGLEFAIGQALGGHMRRHRPVNGGIVVQGKKEEVKKGFWFDLNQPAQDEEEGDECRMVRPTFDFMGIGPGPIVVDCVI
ncbi:hypothetical protein LUZ60_004080 [Juncus effusus]|nr:hypothetical protein LUZ60_004080 [Juncus effusus]